MNEITHIITPTTRPENLFEISKSLKSEYPIVWHVVRDFSIRKNTTVIDWELPANVMLRQFMSPYTAVAGHGHRNFVIDYVLDQFSEDDFIYSVDDDNILHPDFLPQLYSITTPAMTCEQIHKNGKERLKANIVILNHIDTAQVAFKASLLKGLRYDVTRYDADGAFIEELYSRDPSQFTIVNKPLSYYNYLR